LAGALVTAMLSACARGSNDPGNVESNAAATETGAAAETPTSPTATPEPTATPAQKAVADPTATPPPATPTADAIPSVTPNANPGAIFASDPFTLGVASGDPDATSVVLWTRLVPEPMQQDGESIEADVEVQFEVADDPEFTAIVAAGVTMASGAVGHSVHVTPTLPSDRWFYYRFHADGYISPTGRTRTTPTADQTTQPQLTFAFSSCQHYERGLFVGHQHLAERDDIDLMIWLGDYIYEYGPGTEEIPGRQHASPEVQTLDQYRARYEQYKLDADLQAHHAARPWIVTWDDHEVENNYAADLSENGDDPDAFRGRRAAAYQAWYEHQPVRLDPPTGADYRIHRELTWGALARMHVLDTRQYRDPIPTDGAFVPVPGIAPTETPDIRAIGPTAADPEHSMLGAAQEDWLVESVTTSTERWNILAQALMMHGLSILPGQQPPVTATDTWDGYAGNRTALLDRINRAKPDNLVVLSGDFHAATAADLKSDPFDPDGRVVGTELMASAISSRFLAELPEALVAVVLAANPQIELVDTQRGFTVCAVTPDELTAEYFAIVDPANPTTEVKSIATVVIDAGVPGLRR